MEALKQLEREYLRHIQKLRQQAGTFTQPAKQAAYYKIVDKTFEALFLIQFKIMDLERN